ncbi:NUDIX hydrolase [Lentzea flaviverrucosa]|uniref:NUDIX hydrolase n=1 Tax=Lentzea flaviverrucosa TaxID=200379 RepID=UPI000B7C958F|nr:NUDIX hydrolase [Lentzea flaviverrucosa]
MIEHYITNSARQHVTPTFQVDRIDSTHQPSGNRYVRDVVRHPGGACIVPIDGDQVICVEQYRPALERTVLEIPGGRINQGESPEEAAVRELREEAGYVAENASLMMVCHAVPDFSDWKAYLFVSTNVRLETRTHLDSEIPTKVRPISFGDVDRLIEEGALFDAKTVIGLLLARSYCV